jgi:hypothetical protein
VRFKIADVFLPGTEELFPAPPDQTELEGTVVAFSDSGTIPRFFALVEVTLRRTVVVPVEKLKYEETKDL